MLRKSFLLAFLSLGLLGISHAQDKVPSEIRIGVIQSLSGIAAEYGTNNLRALEIARDKINSSGSTKVVLDVEDDRTDSKAAVSAFQKLAASHVDAVIGATWDFTTIPLISLAARRKIPLFTVSALRESLPLELGNGYAFCSGYLTESETAPFEKYLEASSAKKLALLYANNAWGEAQRAAYMKVAHSQKREIVFEAHPANYDANDWSSMLPRIRASSAELLLLLVNPRDIDTVLRRLHEQKIRLKVYTSVNGYDALRLNKDKSSYESICFAYPLAQLRAAKDLSAEFQKRYGEPPRIYADSAYDSLFLLTNAVTSARSKKVTLEEELKAVRLQGISGEYIFDISNSFAIAQTSLVCVKNGAPELR